ncbi:hypothetical protein JCM11251_000832 [Rhodosporidiobolus azoricus]
MATTNQDGTRKWRITVLISGSGSNLQALLDAQSTTLSTCQITSVLSSRSDAYGLTRARSSTPSIPAEAFPLLRWRKAREADGKTGTRDEWEVELAEKIRATRPDLVVLAGWMLILGEGFLNALVRDWDEDDQDSPSTSPSIPPSVDPSGASISTGLSTPGSSPYSLPPSSSSSSSSSLKSRPIPIINLHPALPGQFPGAHAIKDAWDAFNQPAASRLQSGTGVSNVLESIATAGGEEPAVEGESPRRITKTGIMIHRVIPLLDAGAPVVVKEVPMREGESLDELEERIHQVEHVGIVEAVGEVTRLIRDGEWWETKDVGREGGQ